MPAMPPPRRSVSSLAGASRHYARARMQMLSAGEGDMALRAGIADLMVVGEAIQESVDYYGVNTNTASKDERAWELWEEGCLAQ